MGLFVSLIKVFHKKQMRKDNDVNCNTVWTAIGAVGQILCALATFFTALIALKPFKRKMKVGLFSVIVNLDNESQIFPSKVCVVNKGFIEEEIVAVGISSRDGNFVLSEDKYVIEKGGVKEILINHEDVWNNLRLIDDKFFRVWIKDNAGYTYYSKKYPLKKYKNKSMLFDRLK